MAVRIPSDVRRQPSGGASRSDSENETTYTLTESYKGPYDSLLAMARGLEPGGAAHSIGARQMLYTSEWNLERTNAGLGVLTITGTVRDTPLESTGGDKDVNGNPPIKDVWGVQSSRIDRPVECYCSPDTGAPDVNIISAWRNEPDGKLARDFQYRRPDGTIDALDGNNLKVAQKIAEGKVAVMRFYPTATRQRVYAAMPSTMFEKLGVKDTPAPGGKAGNALSALIGSLQWLKVKDDCQQQTDGKWNRSEAWIGMAQIDDDFYAATKPPRWPEPLE